MEKMGIEKGIDIIVTERDFVKSGPRAKSFI